MDDPRPLNSRPPESRDVQLRKRQIAGLLLLALAVLIVVLARAHRGDLFPSGWWRW